MYVGIFISISETFVKLTLADKNNSVKIVGLIQGQCLAFLLNILVKTI